MKPDTIFTTIEVYNRKRPMGKKPGEFCQPKAENSTDVENTRKSFEEMK